MPRPVVPIRRDPFDCSARLVDGLMIGKNHMRPLADDEVLPEFHALGLQMIHFLDQRRRDRPRRRCRSRRVCRGTGCRKGQDEK